MQGYTIYCTEEQTRRAYKLDAPISTIWKYNQDISMVFPTDEDKQSFLNANRYSYLYSTGESNVDKYVCGLIPTTQQMIGWLLSKGVFIDLPCKIAKHYEHSCEKDLVKRLQQAELAVIDAALEYLEKK